MLALCVRMGDGLKNEEKVHGDIRAHDLSGFECFPSPG